jgi:hypothetical protein
MEVSTAQLQSSPAHAACFLVGRRIATTLKHDVMPTLPGSPTCRPILQPSSGDCVFALAPPGDG